jgi:hypothetical protein
MLTWNSRKQAVLIPLVWASIKQMSPTLCDLPDPLPPITILNRLGFCSSGKSLRGICISGIDYLDRPCGVSLDRATISASLLYSVMVSMLAQNQLSDCCVEVA